MKPYILIKGSDKNIEEFESKVSEALEQGYELSNDLVTQVISNDGQNELLMLQALILEEAIEFEEDEEEEAEYESQLA